MGPFGQFMGGQVIPFQMRVRGYGVGMRSKIVEFCCSFVLEFRHDLLLQATS
jgi:hypothetical protein